MLLGATFTSEYAVEGAACATPASWPDADQAGTVASSLRFVMSVRGIGEGHRSSIGFRTGVIDAADGVTIDDPAPFATVGVAEPALLDAAVFCSELARADDAGEAADYVLDRLGERFTRAALDQQFAMLQTSLSTRRHAKETISLLRGIPERTYAVEFSDRITLSERVPWPSMGERRAGRQEDARFVRFIDDDGSVTFSATYTAYSGSTSASNSSRPQISSPSPLRRSSEAPPPIRVWRCFLAGFAVASPPCPDQIANRIRSPTPIICPFGRVRWPATARLKPGNVTTRELRSAHRKPTPGGWCSPTASVRCAPTGSGRFFSISMIRHAFLVSYPNRY